MPPSGINQADPRSFSRSFSLVFLGEFRQRLLPRDNILATVQEGNRGKTEGQRRVVINHARLSDKVAVQQQVLCPLRGCESEERERESRGRVARLINPTDINWRESPDDIGQAGDGRRGLQGI